MPDNDDDPPAPIDSGDNLDAGPKFTEVECRAVFETLFPQGPSGADVLAELAPETAGGWAGSPLRAVFDPGPEQLHREALRMWETTEELFRKRPPKPVAGQDTENDAVAPEPRDPRSAPTLEDITREYTPSPPEPEREVKELFTRCLWDVFSDNHRVFRAGDRRTVDLGSFRGSAGFLAEFANGRWEDEDPMARMTPEALKAMFDAMMNMDFSARDDPNRPYDYMDFYMGTGMVSGRADLGPVYRLIFRRLRARGFDWRYVFPRLLLVDMGGLRDGAADPSGADYDPSEAFAREEAERERKAESAKLRAQMETDHQRAIRAARAQPPPTTVAAYAAVFERWPAGWPPAL